MTLPVIMVTAIIDAEVVMAAAITTIHTIAAFGAGDAGVEHCKAERSARGDGQEDGLAKHGTLLCDPRGIVKSPIRALVGWPLRQVQCHTHLRQFI